MNRVLKIALVSGAAVGAVFAAKNLLGGGNSSSDEATLTFADGTTKTLNTSDIQGQELVDIARKLVQSGV